MADILQITHKDTTKILNILRDFIPPFTDSDYINEPGELWNGCLIWENLTNIYGHRTIGFEGFSAGESRQSIFSQIVSSLGTFDQGEQLKRLQRMIQILRLDHLKSLENNDFTFAFFMIFETRFLSALGYIFDGTKNMMDVEFTEFVAHLNKHYPDFNPLSIDAATKFNDILKAYKK